MRMALLLVCSMVTSARAEVSPADQAATIVSSHVVASRNGPIRFGFSLEGNLVSAGPSEGGGAPMHTEGTSMVVGISAEDKRAAWVALDLKWWSACDSATQCKGKAPMHTLHATLLMEQKPNGSWGSSVFHFAKPFAAKAYADARKQGRTLAPLPKKIDAGAEDAVKLFETTIGDPSKFAATVSARKDVVLYGSELAERFVGGDVVKKQLAKWDLAMKVRDGIQAGVTSGKTVAWVAANVDVVPAKSSKSNPSPYRLLALYEKTGATWQLVQASFSFYVNPYAE